MFSEFVDRANVGMVERRGGARLAAETLQRLRIAAQLFGQKLQRHTAAQLEVLGTIDHAHAAAADDVQHAIVRNRPAGQRSRVGLHAHGGASVACDLSTRFAGRIFGGSHPLHRHHQPVAAAGHGLDVLRLVGRIAERLAAACDGDVDAVVELDDGVVRPELLLDLLASRPVRLRARPACQQDGTVVPGRTMLLASPPLAAARHSSPPSGRVQMPRSERELAACPSWSCVKISENVPCLAPKCTTSVVESKRLSPPQAKLPPERSLHRIRLQLKTIFLSGLPQLTPR